VLETAQHFKQQNFQAMTFSAEVALVFPHQLFYDHTAFSEGRSVVLVEEFLFFKQYQFHKHKLMLHRASMKCYEEVIQHHGYATNYIESHQENAEVQQTVRFLVQQKVSTIHVADVADYMLQRRLSRACKQHGLQLVVHDSPNFLWTKRELERDFAGKKKFLMYDFYVARRKQEKILVDCALQPEGGKWTFDTENRKKMPAGTRVPALPLIVDEDGFVAEAAEYVDRHFPQNYGSTEGFIYPITPQKSQEWLEQFATERLGHYGEYQDAIVKKETFLFHAIITPMLNVGLLNPREVMHKVLEIGGRNGAPLNSVEGFVRQVMGWREYVRAIYEFHGVKQRTTNFWNHKRRIPKSFWEGTTGILPIDTVVKRTDKHAYAHHIERLMILGNFMLLCEFDPDEVYRWFMEFFVDAYDWVMVPNVYGMSQFADGGMMCTKPYISGSNYVLKMSDFEKGPWCEIWDALFWRFIAVHREYFVSNFRLSMMARTWDKMPADKKQHHLDIAEKWLAECDTMLEKSAL
jgi:deoxyribodipyrimidine photolyase-related protein